MNKIAITIDMDWAPDEVIVQVARRLIASKIKTTWFITHESPEIKRLKKYPKLFELGLHPNFATGSTQGKNVKEIMNYLLKIVPGAKSIRTHGLIQSTELLKVIREKFNIRYDVSLFLPRTPNIVPHEIFWIKNLSLIRFPYFWEDDEESNRSRPLFNINHSEYRQPGLKIFNFHPIHIVLNSRNMNKYELMKEKINYPKASLKELNSYIFNGKGVGTFFEGLLQFISKNKLRSQTISELAHKYKSKIK
jgi:hypothetical protein